MTTAEVPTPVLERTVENNVDRRKQLCPDGWVEIDTYHPTSSVTPWDYYGGKHQREYCKVLCSAGLTPLALKTNETIVRPIGTGPGGAVRFGDNMLPGVYRIAVPAGQQAAACAAIEAHKVAIREWLDNGGEMPEACR